jgi:hypothetical protein
MRHARNADAGRLRDLSFYIGQLTVMITEDNLTGPDAATVPKRHIARYLPEKKGIIAADPMWNVPFRVCASFFFS